MLAATHSMVPLVYRMALSPSYHVGRSSAKNTPNHAEPSMVTTAQPQQAASAAGLNNLHTDAVISNQYLSNQANHHAAVIQKHWRGYQVRKSLQHLHLDAAHSQERATAAATAQLLATRQAGAQNAEYPEIWRPSTGTVVRSRGCLQAALSHRSGQLTQQEGKVQQWRQFTARQAERYVPASAKQTRRILSESASYRLRIQSVSNLPPLSQATYGVTYELQLAVSLFDESLGVFYGNTCYSPSDVPEQQQQPADAADGAVPRVGVDFCFDVFFHSTISDPQCMAVVEVIMMEKDALGVSAGQFSIGWAQLPLFAQNGQLPGSQPAAAPIMSGTPRYLLFRSICAEEELSPSVLPGCHVTYQAEAYPAMNPVRPLLPPDFLVSYADTVPGLRRFDCNGQLTTSCKSVISTLASPMLAPQIAVQLGNLQLRLPQMLHNLLSVLPQLVGVLPPPDLPSLLAVPSQPLAVKYSLVVGVHIGRTFIGPQQTIQQLLVQPSIGSVVLKTQEGLQQLTLPGVVADEMVVLVLELLAEAAAEAGAASQLGPVLVGRTALSPFKSISADGDSTVLSEGLHTLSFGCSSSTASSSSSGSPLSLIGGVTQGMLPVNWRALLGDTAVKAVPDPALEFELNPAGRAGQLLAEPKQLLAAVAPTAVPIAAQQPKQTATPPPARAAAGKQQAQQVVVEVAQATEPVGDDALTPLPGDTRASMSLRLAAKHLEAAASIPTEESDTQLTGLIPAHRGSDKQRPAGGVDQGDKQQLQQLTDTMQQQISALARAVEELKEERQTLRSSLTVLESATTAYTQHSTCIPTQQPTTAASSGHDAGSTAENHSSRSDSPQVPPSSIPAAELERLKALQPTAGVAGFEVPAGFSGAQAAAVQGMGMTSSSSSGTPSRAVMQQLHEAGMGQALPTDVQALLRRSAAAAGSPRKRPAGLRDQYAADGTSTLSPLVMDIEARDPRTASDVVLQLLAFRPTDSPEAAAQLPAALSSLYFTLQFYHFSPVASEPCLLSGSDGTSTASGGMSAGVGALGQQYGQQLSGQEAAAGTTSLTFILQPVKQVQRSGAGLVMKYQVDGSNPSQLLPGQDPGQAAFDAHVAFCNHLAKRKLNIDIWDGDSLLQLGTTTVSLQGLLRQGREFCELLVEAPIMQLNSGSSQQSSAVPGQHAEPQARQPLQLGHLVLRLINIGREPSNAAAKTPDFDAAQLGAKSTGKKVRVRAAPLEPGSPIAKELRSRQGSSSPFKVNWQQQQQQQLTAGDGSPQAASASVDAATAASDIISFEQRKVARAQQLKQLFSSSPTKGPPGSPVHNTFMQPTPHNSPVRRPGAAAATQASGIAAWQQQADPFRAVQWQLLADVDAVRKRQKAGFIRSQLRKDLVTPCAIQPSLGQALLLEHMLHNPLGRDAVFELKVSHPDQLRALDNVQEYRHLQHAAGPAIITSAPAAAAAQLDAALSAAGAAGMPSLAQLATGSSNTADAEQLVNKGRIFLAANERVNIPFVFRLNSGLVQADSSQQQQQCQQHVVTVEFAALELDYPVNILELQVQPKPVGVDRTLRYHCPEREVLRASIPLATLSGTASQELLTAAAGGALLAAASRPDVTVDVSSAAVAGSKGLGEVSLRFKCGLSPEVVQFHVWLYGDACMAKPLEVWQVFVHALQKVDMRAVVGQNSSTSLAVAGGTAGDRQVVCYSSNPVEVQPSPAVLKLPAGGISALLLMFKPCKAGKEWVRVHLVDPASKQLIHAFLVVTEASLPQISRRLEVDLQAGTVAQRQFTYASPYNNQSRTIQRYKFTTNTPWLLSLQPAVLELPPKGSKAVSLVIDGRGLQMGATVQALLFVHDDHDREEECMEVLVNAL